MRTILYYAAGGGLGHVVRAASFLHTRGLEARSVIVTSLAPEDIPAGVTEVPRVSIPPTLHSDAPGLSRWIEAFLEMTRIEVVYLDAFPQGPIGEWARVRRPPGLGLHHVARLLAWDRYPHREPVPRFEVTYQVEALDPVHHAYLAACSGKLETLDLVDPPAPVHAAGVPLDPGDWLVVHSGPTAEVEELVRYAEEARRIEGARVSLAVATRAPLAMPGVRRCSGYPASRWFPDAGRVISGAGFNVMRQMRPWAGKHRFFPFERRYDDQFERARRRREEGPAWMTA